MDLPHSVREVLTSVAGLLVPGVGALVLWGRLQLAKRTRALQAELDRPAVPDAPRDPGPHLDTAIERHYRELYERTIAERDAARAELLRLRWRHESARKDLGEEATENQRCRAELVRARARESALMLEVDGLRKSIAAGEHDAIELPGRTLDLDLVDVTEEDDRRTDRPTKGTQ